MITATVKYAYNPRQGNRSGLYEGNDSHADCKRCVELALRHGVTEVPVPR